MQTILHLWRECLEILAHKLDIVIFLEYHATVPASDPLNPVITLTHGTAAQTHRTQAMSRV